MTAFTGKDIALEISYDTGTPSYVRLGRCTSKSRSTNIDNIDVTADDSPGSFREYIETFTGGSLSFSVYPGEDAARGAAIDDLDEFIKDPSAQSKTERRVLLKTLRPKSGTSATRQEVAEFLLTSSSEEGPHDGAVAYSFEAIQTGPATLTDA